MIPKNSEKTKYKGKSVKLYTKNPNHINNIGKDNNNIDTNDDNSDEYKESMMKMRYDAFQVSEIRFMILFQCQ